MKKLAVVISRNEKRKQFIHEIPPKSICRSIPRNSFSVNERDRRMQAGFGI